MILMGHAIVITSVIISWHYTHAHARLVDQQSALLVQIFRHHDHQSRGTLATVDRHTTLTLQKHANVNYLA